LVADQSIAQSYRRINQWVVDALRQIGVPADHQPLNDIATSLGKIAGSAQKRTAAGAVLHHMMLAYRINGQQMRSLLRVGQAKLASRGVKSADRRVDPVSNHTSLDRLAIVDHLIDQFTSRYQTNPSALNSEEIALADQLVGDKFGSGDWLGRVP
ncbi:MAG: lipoate--protein ligase family protein, partial [Propionibacteriaceae bacterium]|nr:lipoate--protein ligase family protein [Propionibacteriaceae bacterium]